MVRTKSEKNYETAAMLLIVVIVFAASFYYFSFIQLREHKIYGITILSRSSPLEEMKGIVRNGSLMEMRTYDGSDSRNGYVALLSAEMAGAFSSQNKTVRIYGIVEKTGEKINCRPENNGCSNPDIIVRIGSCNCMKIEGRTLYVEFDEKTIGNAETRTTISGIIGGVLKSG